MLQSHPSMASSDFLTCCIMAVCLLPQKISTLILKLMRSSSVPVLLLLPLSAQKVKACVGRFKFHWSLSLLFLYTIKSSSIQSSVLLPISFHFPGRMAFSARQGDNFKVVFPEIDSQIKFSPRNLLGPVCPIFSISGFGKKKKSPELRNIIIHLQCVIYLNRLNRLDGFNVRNDAKIPRDSMFEGN